MFGTRIKIVVFDFNYIVLVYYPATPTHALTFKGLKDENNSLQLNNVGGDHGEKEGDMAMHKTNDLDRAMKLQV